jgi:hydroxylaminobenzene mutase
MDTSDQASRQGRHLLQGGILLFLFALLVGLLIPKFAVPRLGLSVHLLGIMQGTFLAVLGLLWPKLKLTYRMSWVGFWLILYGFLAAWIANVLAGVWGAGSSLLPMVAGQAQGSPLQEGIIMIGLRTAAMSQITALLVVLWGLRGFMEESSDQ